MTDDLTRTVEGEGGSGRLVGGRYQLVRRIGEGGMGEVFEAFDETLERRVALKRPPREAWVDIDARNRILDEARLQAKLRHPHIVGVQDVIDEGLGKPIWMVMDFIEGQTLKTVLRRRGRLKPKIAVKLMKQVALALRAAHKAGVVHRDLKPSNIMIGKNGWTYVLDFGIARLVQQTIVTLTGRQTSGTPLYMAPEQHLGGRKAKDKRVDIFAFGCVLYEMLTGVPAFAEAANPVIAKERRAYDPLSELAPDVPAELVAVVDKCLAPEQKERFSKFGDVALALGKQTAQPAVATGRGMRSPRVSAGPPAGLSVESPEPKHAAVGAVVVKAPEWANVSELQLQYARQSGLDVAKELDLGGGVKMKLVLIPPGEFTMGSNDGSRNEKPVHEVRITKPFYMAMTEVTQAEYETVMGKNPSWHSGRYLTRGPSKRPRNPVERVSWREATEFCGKLRQKEGVDVGLPTEAQWEYACRAGTTTAYCFGDSSKDLKDYAWHRSIFGVKTHPVGQKKPNGWGLYDMHGNVWEWCRDWYGKDYYDKSPVDDPQGPKNGEYRVLRGGAWNNNASHCRSASRYNYAPTYANLNLGFRVVSRDFQ